MKRVRNSLAVLFIVFNFLFIVPTASAVEEVTTIVTPGGDDTSYQIPLTVPVVYDGTSYQNVYATTNSVITFGNPDGTYWTYPQTPSISIESRDWWALPYYNPDMHFIINASAGGFQVDGSYLPFGTTTGQVTNIVITAQIQTDGTVAYTYAVTGPTYSDDRTGARLTDGTVVTLEQAGVTQVEQAPVLEPTPVPPEPAPVEPTPEPQPQPQPTPQYQPQPQPEPIPGPVPVEPTPEPAPEVIPEPVPVEDIPITPEPIPEPEVVVEEPVVTDEVTLDNGVTITKQEAAAVALIQNPTELLTTLFTNPMEALSAINQVGADMSPEVREKSEEVVVAAVIVGNIASAAGAVAYRRKP